MTDPRAPRDPKLEVPGDIEKIAESIPVSGAASALRRLIGLLPRPIGPGFPNPGGGVAQGEDPAIAAQQLAYQNMYSGFGSQPGSMIGDGTIPGSAITPGSLDPAAFASTIATVKLVSANPTLPNALYPNDQIIFNTTDNQLYKNTAGTWVAMVNTTDLVGTISAAQIAAGAITAGKIAANAVTAGTIAAGAVTATELAAGSVTAGKIGAAAISASNIQAGTITTDRLVVAGIDLSTIGLSGSIVNGLLATDSIDARTIAAGAITATDITTGTLTGVAITGCNITAGGSGVDGFQVVNSSGTNLGHWTSAGLNCGEFDASGTASFGGWVLAGNGLTVPDLTGIGGAPLSLGGSLAIDHSSGTFGRFYGYHSGAWHYVAFTAGFVVPVQEVRCPACEQLMLPGEDLIGVGDRFEHDGALHGLWKHMSCAGRPSGRLADQYADPSAIARLTATVKGLIRRAGLALPDPRTT